MLDAEDLVEMRVVDPEAQRCVGVGVGVVCGCECDVLVSVMCRCGV